MLFLKFFLASQNKLNPLGRWLLSQLDKGTCINTISLVFYFRKINLKIFYRVNFIGRKDGLINAWFARFSFNSSGQLVGSPNNKTLTVCTAY